MSRYGDGLTAAGIGGLAYGWLSDATWLVFLASGAVIMTGQLLALLGRRRSTASEAPVGR